MKNGVYLVGAGPGDKKLITVKGMELLRMCDAIVYDQLANPLFLSETKAKCEKIYVGKKAGNHTLKQDDINELLLNLSKEHNIVVRLKGGDPYVFGRGSEEAQYLLEHHIYVEVVPGITSAIGGLAAAGIPITARNMATSFHVVTGHLSNDSEPVNYKALAQLKGTLVFLMGVGNLTNIVAELLLAGKSAQTPAAIIYKASTPEQKVYKGTLQNIREIAESENVKPPSLIVIGDVVAFSDTLKPQKHGQLNGVKVVVTRASQRISKFTDKLEKFGAEVIPMPTIKYEEINQELLIDQIKRLQMINGMIFTSSVAAEIFFKTLFEMGHDARSLYGKEIFVIGKETGLALKKFGIIADTMPGEFSKEGILQHFASHIAIDKEYLLPGSARSDKEWVNELGKYIKPMVIDCYTTKTEFDTYWDKEVVKDADYICFTSTSTVEGFIERLKAEGLNVSDIVEGKKIVAIGPSTKKSLEAFKIRVTIMPENATIQNMVDCIHEDYTEGADDNE